MPWNAIWPIGTISVRANRTTGNQNTAYIGTTMGDAAVGSNAVTTTDHFWNVSADLDGHHRFMKCAAFTVGGLPADPVSNNAFIQGIYYAKTKTVAESTVQQDTQCFYRNQTNVMQLLGIRAMACFNVVAGVVTIVYKHNITSVVRTASGRFTVTYATALPSQNYLVLGGAIRDTAATGTELLFEVNSSNVLTNVKSTTTLLCMTKSDGGSFHDPLQAWFVCFGG